MKKTILGLAVLGLAINAAALASGVMPVAEEQYAQSGFLIGADVGYGYLGTPEHDLFNVPEKYFEWIEEGGYNSFDGNHTHHTHHTHYFLDEGHTIGGFVWGANIGYDFAVSPKAEFGVEVGYKDLGKSKYHSKLTIEDEVIGPPSQPPMTDLHVVELDWHHKVTQQAVDFLLTGHYYVYQGVNVFAKGGVAYVGSKSTWDLNAFEYIREYHHNGGPTYEDEVIFDDSIGGSKNIWRFRPEVALGIGYSFNRNFDMHVMYDYIDGAYNDHGTKLLPYSPAKIYSSNMVTVGASWKF